MLVAVYVLGRNSTTIVATIATASVTSRMGFFFAGEHQQNLDQIGFVLVRSTPGCRRWTRPLPFSTCRTAVGVRLRWFWSLPFRSIPAKHWLL